MVITLKTNKFNYLKYIYIYIIKMIYYLSDFIN